MATSPADSRETHSVTAIVDKHIVRRPLLLRHLGTTMMTVMVLMRVTMSVSMSVIVDVDLFVVPAVAPPRERCRGSRLCVLGGLLLGRRLILGRGLGDLDRFGSGIRCRSRVGGRGRSGGGDFVLRVLSQIDRSKADREEVSHSSGTPA
jgi:hypothetical protein